MKNRREKIIKMYFIDKLRPVDIANELQISKSAITQVLQKDERYTNEKEIRKENNRIKHNENAKAITKKQRKIKQYTDESDRLMLKVMHDQDARQLSQPKKLSNLAYRNWNISAYKYDEDNKRFEFREELGRSADIPKYIKVEV